MRRGERSDGRRHAQPGDRPDQPGSLRPLRLEVEKLGRAAMRIEEHCGRPMDIECAKDGKTVGNFTEQDSAVNAGEVDELMVCRSFFG